MKTLISDNIVSEKHLVEIKQVVLLKFLKGLKLGYIEVKGVSLLLWQPT